MAMAMATARVDLSQIAQDVEIVLRAGDVRHRGAKRRLQGGYYASISRYPDVSGLWVLFRPGASVDDLAREGRFPHPKLGVATVGELIAALRTRGYDLILFVTPTFLLPDHHTLAVAQGQQVLDVLPDHAAEALLGAMRVVDNAYRKIP